MGFRKLKNVTKEDFIKLYVEDRLTTYQIAEIYNVNRTSICKALKRHGIELNGKQREFEDIKKIPLTQEQIEILVGTVLGDGCLAPKGRKNLSYRLLVSHCDKQKDFLIWKKEKFGKLINRELCGRASSEKNSFMWSISSLVHEDFRKFYHLFYDENGIKVITKEILEYITPLAVAVWFLDDGTTGKYDMSIATYCFTESENILFQKMFKEKFNIDCNVRKFKRGDKIWTYLRFNKAGAILLTELIRPYVSVECMKYKLLKY